MTRVKQYARLGTAMVEVAMATRGSARVSIKRLNGKWFVTTRAKQ